MRYVICHYHLFKNSGSTVDKILENTFGNKLIKFDGPFPYFCINQFELDKIIRRNEGKIAFSSHQIFLPPPESDEYKVIPIVFVRHPLCRIYSIYNYKKSLNDGTLTCNLARKYDFEEWIKKSCDYETEFRHISNAQTNLLAKSFLTGESEVLSESQEDGIMYNIDKLIENIEVVEYFGRTEYFEQDILTIAKSINELVGTPLDLSDTKAVNISTGVESLEDKIIKIKGELSSEVYDYLTKINQQDIWLYDRASRGK